MRGFGKGRSDESVSKLQIYQTVCGACGLCCNGGLFNDVELKRRDRTDDLAAMGATLFIKENGRRALAQPCPALEEDGACCVYDSRPTRCQQFECRVLKSTLKGRVSIDEALEVVETTRAEYDRVASLLDQLAPDSRGAPLQLRWIRWQRLPLDVEGATDEELAWREALVASMSTLSELYEREFV